LPEDGYKQKVDALLEPFGKRIIDEHMMDYDLIIGTFMMKGAGENSAMYPHQDWTLVDETKHASFNIWIPLIDVDFKNGAMSIMNGGHQMPFTKRGSCVPDALQDYTQFYPDNLTYLPMKAGQALIYDHRCIHVSPPNISGKVRPACAIGIAPKATEVFHYYYDKNNLILKKYKADKNFYFNHVYNQIENPDNAQLLSEEKVEGFKKFTNEELIPFFKQQQIRKKSFLEKYFNIK
jgi:Phytanoyl-CoA dioxygenase (PhyH)